MSFGEAMLVETVVEERSVFWIFYILTGSTFLFHENCIEHF